MKSLVLFATLAALAFSSATAQDTNYAVRIPCDFQDAKHGLPDLPLLQGSAPCLAVDPMRGVYPIPSDPLTTVQLILAPTATGTYFVATNAYLATNDSYFIQLGTIGTNSCPTNSTVPAPWFYTVLFSRNGGVYWSGNGKAYIEAAAFTGTNGLVWQTWAAGAAKDDLAREWILDLSNVVDNIEVGSTVYGITNGSAYRGDWGHSVSGRVVTVEGWGNHALAGYALSSSLIDYVLKSSTNGWEVGSHSAFLVGATITGGTVTTNAGVLDFTIDGIDAATAGQIVTNVLDAQTAESTVQPVSLADGYVTFWSTGREEQIYVAQGVATVRWMRAAGSLTNASTIATYLCLTNHTTYFQTNNLADFTTNGLSYNGGTNLAVVWSRPGSTNHVYKLIK